MVILAIETSMGRTSVALTAARQGEPMLVRQLGAGKRQAEHLIPLIETVMAEASLAFSSLDLVAVCVGPGGFSGIRTGVAAARGIGLAADVPVVGATSFRIMAAAFGERRELSQAYGLVAPAGSGAVFCQIVRRCGRPLSDIVVLPYEATSEFFAQKAELLAGPAAAILLEAAAVSLPVDFSELFPDAGTLALIAPGLDPKQDLPLPCYARDADAKPQSKHLIARQDE